jgi:hypothetical protein
MLLNPRAYDQLAHELVAFRDRDLHRERRRSSRRVLFALGLATLLALQLIAIAAPTYHVRVVWLAGVGFALWSLLIVVLIGKAAYAPRVPTGRQRFMIPWRTGGTTYVTRLHRWAIILSILGMVPMIALFMWAQARHQRLVEAEAQVVALRRANAESYDSIVWGLISNHEGIAACTKVEPPVYHFQYKYIVQPDGSVTFTYVEKNGVGGPKILDCLNNAARELRVPRPPGGEPYPSGFVGVN